MAPPPFGILLTGLLLAAAVSLGSAFRASPLPATARRTSDLARCTLLAAEEGDDAEMGGVDEYRNPATALLSNFMQKDGDGATAVDPLADIDFDAPKVDKLPLETLATALDAELYEKEWFVTGNVNPIYFSDEFRFQDPDVKLTGIEEYARGVTKIFDQDASRAEIISSVVNATVPDTITVTWRLSGRVNIGPKGLPIKPYICYTDFTVDPDTGLIVFQEDRFAVPGWDILLSALFPFLIGKVTSDPAPEVEPRVVKMPRIRGAKNPGMLDGLLQQLGL
ncbi:hypothetical protein ACHAXT_004973 [Thalassiosira profunda]